MKVLWAVDKKQLHIVSRQRSDGWRHDVVVPRQLHESNPYPDWLGPIYAKHGNVIATMEVLASLARNQTYRVACQHMHPPFLCPHCKKGE